MRETKGSVKKWETIIILLRSQGGYRHFAVIGAVIEINSFRPAGD